MLSDESKDILELLSQGIDPITGEVLPDSHLINNPRIVRALFAIKEVINSKSSKKLNDEDLILSIEEEEVYETLRALRNKIAKKEQLPAYMILENKPLIRVVKAFPRTEEELLKVKGFGPVKVEKYGDDILDILEDSI